MRARYHADPQLWIDLVEQAAFEVGDVVLVCAECGPERPDTGEAFARCHRRVLRDLLIAVATDRGLLVDPDTDALDRTLLEARRREVLTTEGFPLTCPVCRRPAGTARAIRGRNGYWYCSETCVETDEDSVTFAGTWLVPAVKAAWPGWAEARYEPSVALRAAAMEAWHQGRTRPDRS
jgi:hypothetical protein